LTLALVAVCQKTWRAFAASPQEHADRRPVCGFLQWKDHRSYTAPDTDPIAQIRSARLELQRGIYYAEGATRYAGRDVENVLCFIAPRLQI
jgi:hypothetical protein